MVLVTIIKDKQNQDKIEGFVKDLDSKSIDRKTLKSVDYPLVVPTWLLQEQTDICLFLVK